MVEGRPVEDHRGVLACLHNNPCKTNDDRQQMLVLRDPRAVVVSSYYYLKVHPRGEVTLRPKETLENFVLRMVPTICRFTHLRYTFLQENMPERTVEFLYNDSLADPLLWHQRWLDSVGLNLPDGVVRSAVDTANRRDFGFAAKGIDPHPGGEKPTPRRSYEDELSPEIRQKLDDSARVWLPPVLLEKFGISRV